MKKNENKQDVIPAFFLVFFLLFVMGSIFLLKSL